MALIKWKKDHRCSPFLGLFNIQKDIDRLFNPLAEISGFQPKDECVQKNISASGREPMTLARGDSTRSLFDDVVKNAGIFKNAFAPALDLYEDKDNLVIKADLPGLKQGEIEVGVDGDILTIKGEKKQEAEKKEKNCYRFVRTYGSFSRSIALPKHVDASKTNASFKNGVLELIIPKTEEAKKNNIKVNASKQ